MSPPSLMPLPNHALAPPPPSPVAHHQAQQWVQQPQRGQRPACQRAPAQRAVQQLQRKVHDEVLVQRGGVLRRQRALGSLSAVGHRGCECARGCIVLRVCGCILVCMSVCVCLFLAAVGATCYAHTRLGLALGVHVALCICGGACVHACAHVSAHVSVCAFRDS